jgi:hypothetical protein
MDHIRIRFIWLNRGLDPPVHRELLEGKERLSKGRGLEKRPHGWDRNAKKGDGALQPPLLYESTATAID